MGIKSPFLDKQLVKLCTQDFVNVHESVRHLLKTAKADNNVKENFSILRSKSNCFDLKKKN